MQAAQCTKRKLLAMFQFFSSGALLFKFLNMFLNVSRSCVSVSRRRKKQNLGGNIFRIRINKKGINIDLQ